MNLLPRFALLTLASFALSSCYSGKAAAGLSISHPDDATKQVECFARQRNS